MSLKGSFNIALAKGRPPNIKKLFPNSKALIVTSKFINMGMAKKKKSICIAANARNLFIIKGVLKAAQRAKSAIIIEIAKSEGGINGYCAINYWNIARVVDSLCNELSITVPVSIHADHYTIKSSKDTSLAIVEIPTLFEYGITSIAVDASHLPDAENLLTTIKLNKFIPKWSGLEVEVGEIKGNLGLSTQDEAEFMIRGLNAYEIFPDWIALNNGTTHGMESNGEGIRVNLTSRIHNALSKYWVYGAQHGTSGNTTSKLREIASKTRTTKANIATSLQMTSWGVKVNKYGNPEIDEEGNLIKISGKGMNKDSWSMMTKYADKLELHGTNYKMLNSQLENKLLSQPKKFRERMSNDVEDFVYDLLTNVFNTENTAEIVLKDIIDAGNYFPKSSAGKIEDSNDWTQTKIFKKALKLNKNETIKGKFDD